MGERVEVEGTMQMRTETDTRKREETGRPKTGKGVVFNPSKHNVSRARGLSAVPRAGQSPSHTYPHPIEG